MPKEFIAGNVLDVGSYRVGENDHTHHEFIPPDWKYTGLDIRRGVNVNVVVHPFGPWPLGDQTYDAVISGQTLEHCRRPWIVAKEMVRVTKIGGIILLGAPFMWHYHEHPGDYYRYTGSGLAELLINAGGVVIREAGQANFRPDGADAWCAAERLE